MHYSDGTPAQVGDIVRGRGYNLPYDLVGPVTKLLPEMGAACNIRIEVRVAKWIPFLSDGDGGTDRPAHWEFEIYEEAGECKAFTLVVRNGWHQVQSRAMVWETQPPFVR